MFKMYMTELKMCFFFLEKSTNLTDLKIYILLLTVVFYEYFQIGMVYKFAVFFVSIARMSKTANKNFF